MEIRRLPYLRIEMTVRFARFFPLSQRPGNDGSILAACFDQGRQNEAQELGDNLPTFSSSNFINSGLHPG